MARIQFNGHPGTYQTPEGFENLPPAEQEAMAAEFVAHLDAKAKEARDSKLVAPTTPVIGPIARGVARAQSSLADTADLASKGAGDAIRSTINPDFLNAETAGKRFHDKWGAGNYLSALTEGPSMALEGVPQLLGGVAAAAGGGAAGTAVGGPGFGTAAGATAGTAAYMAAMFGGQSAKARAANNGRTEPSASDIALGVGGQAVIGAIPGVNGLGGLARSAIGTGARGAAGAVLRHAASDAAQATATKLLDTAGTDAGTQLPSVADLAENTLTGAVTRSGLGAVRGVSDRISGSPPASVVAERRAALAERFRALSDEDQTRSVDSAAALKMVQDTRANDTNRDPGHYPDTLAAKTTLGNLKTQGNTFVDSLVSGGVLDSAGAKSLKGVLSDAGNTQRGQDRPTLEHIMGDLPLSASDRTLLTDLARQMDLVSQASVGNRNEPSGRVAHIATALGGVGGLSVGTAVGHPFVGLQTGRMAGSWAGQFVMNKLGLTAPKLIEDGARAITMMEAAGMAIPDTRAKLMEASRASKDVVARQAEILGLDPRTFSISAAKKKVEAYARDKASSDLSALRDQEAVDKSQADAAAQIAKQRDRAYAEVQRQRAEDGRVNLEVEKAYQTPDAAKRAQEDAMWRQHLSDTSKAESGVNRRALGIGMDQNRAFMASGNGPTPGKPPASPPAVTGLSQVALEAPRLGGAKLPDPGQSADIVTRPRTKASRGPQNPMTELVLPDQATGGPLPNWMFRLGSNLETALTNSGSGKPVNTAKEVTQSLHALVTSGALPVELAQALLAHDGAVVWGVYNMIRNDMLLRHGIDRRTLQEQGLTFDDFNRGGGQ